MTYLHGHGERGRLELGFDDATHSLRGLEEVGDFVRGQLVEPFHTATR